MDEGFPRSLRLRRSQDFRRVQRRGRRVHTKNLVVCSLSSGLGSSRFGLTVSKKVGNAVVRNRVKRRLREAIRRHHHGLTGLDVVFIARPSAHQADAASLAHQVQDALRTVRSRANPSPRGR